MEIYIECYILNNFILNYLLNYLVIRFSALQFSYVRLLITTILEVIFTTIFIYINESSVLIKLVEFLLISIMLIKVNNIYEYFKVCIIFLITSALVGGVINLILNSICINFYNINFTIRLLVVYAIILCLFFMHKTVVRKIKKHKMDLLCFQNIILRSGKIKIHLLAYYDTGNKLYLKNNGVCILDSKVAKKLELVTNEEVVVNTINDSKLLKVGTVDEIYLLDEHKKYTNIFCAIADDMSEYKFILHRDLR